MKINENTFSDIKVLIIGDVMIDQYMIGKVYRKSPEADIPVLEDVSIDSKLGGAANVAMNIKGLGAQPLLLSVVGNDSSGDKVEVLLAEAGIMGHLVRDKDRKTTVKTRVFVESQQIVRVDQEDKHNLNNEINEEFLNQLNGFIKTSKPQIVILQDYNKGVLHAQNISRIIQVCKRENIFISVDPKFDNFREYRGANLFKPNMKELLAQSAQIDKLGKFEVREIEELASKIRKEIALETILVTLSEYGAMIVEEKGSLYKAAEIIEVVDVCGAGDAVMAVVSLLKFLDFSQNDILEMTNQTGKIVCGKTGVSSIRINELHKKI